VRTHGTLTRWNDDRGFGFITPARGDAQIFVHVSAFPRDGGRPRLNELISFEVEAGPDGRQRAVRVMRPAQRTAPNPSVARQRQQQRYQGSKVGGTFVLIAVAAIGIYGYFQLSKPAPPEDTYTEAPLPLMPEPQRYSCDGRTMCPQMNSCAEATYFLRNCPDTKMDGDRDGVPCEDQWC
jgi:cold shock CspA family protein